MPRICLEEGVGVWKLSLHSSLHSLNMTCEAFKPAPPCAGKLISNPHTHQRRCPCWISHIHTTHTHTHTNTHIHTNAHTRTHTPHTHTHLVSDTAAVGGQVFDGAIASHHFQSCLQGAWANFRPYQGHLRSSPAANSRTPIANNLPYNICISDAET